jgi:hypothetical protein
MGLFEFLFLTVLFVLWCRGYVGIHSSGFRDFLLKPELLRAIVDSGFEHPSEGKFYYVLSLHDSILAKSQLNSTNFSSFGLWLHCLLLSSILDFLVYMYSHVILFAMYSCCHADIFHSVSFSIYFTLSMIESC